MWLGLVIAITLLLVPIWCVGYFSHCCDQSDNIISRRKDSIWLTASEILEYLPYPILEGRVWQSRTFHTLVGKTQRSDRQESDLWWYATKTLPSVPSYLMLGPTSEFSELKIAPPSGNHAFKSCVYERLNTVIGHNRKYSRLRNSAFKNNLLCFFF